jgi:hypothetical protein
LRAEKESRSKKNERKLLVIQILITKKIDLVDSVFHLIKRVSLKCFLSPILPKK